MSRALLIVALFALTGCQLLGSHDVAKTGFDFGPPATHGSRSVTDGLAANVAVSNIAAPGWIDNPSMYYRLTYRNATNPLPYAHSQWVSSPAALLTQRLRWTLGSDNEPYRLSDGGSEESYVLRGELLEFEQIFDQPGRSRGVLRLRATLEGRRGGWSERTFEIEEPAPTPDAVGGVKALSLCAVELSNSVSEWVRDQVSVALAAAH